MSVAAAHMIYMAAIRRGDRKKLKLRTIADKDEIYTRDIGPRLGGKVLAALGVNQFNVDAEDMAILQSQAAWLTRNPGVRRFYRRDVSPPKNGLGRAATLLSPLR